MTSESDRPKQPASRVTLAMPDGELRRRLLEVLADTDVEVDILDTEDPVRGAQDARGDVVLVGSDQVQASDLDALGEIAQDDDEAGVVVVGEEDPGARARLLAAGLSSVVSAEQDPEGMANSLEALAEAEAAGASRGPEVGGSATEPRLADFQTRSDRMRAFVDLVQRVIPADTSLLITGPTGVGKEHLARAVHFESPRASGPFVDVNCAALPEQLLEAELFGHRKGAFTGADRARKGHFERASGGTIFLDEIGEMPMHLQVKLLTVLQRHEVTPVGAEEPVHVDVRIMAATNRDLREEIAANRFREDLFYRLNVVPLQIPALSERPEDVPELIGRFIQHFRTAMPVSSIEGISDAAVRALMAYDWPGNVRELINIVERAMLLGRSTQISLEDLPPAISQLEVPGDPTGAVPAAPGNGEHASGEHAGGEHPGGNPGGGVPEDWFGKSIKDVREVAVRQAEAAYLRAVLERHGGHLGEVAKVVGLSARALYEKMKRYDLRKEDFKDS